MTEESHQQLLAENVSRQQQIEEQERKIEAAEVQLNSTREQLEAHLKTILDTKKELERISVCFGTV